jgi:proline iminopeptidase
MEQRDERRSKSCAVVSENTPRATGRLGVGDGHELHWELWGNQDGKPALALHGGPGSGCSPWWPSLFDLERYCVVIFDQRGCGRSTPGADQGGLRANTTWHVVADIERLRRHLDVREWLVLGGSWGSTLALTYAQEHRQRISELVLFSVVTTTPREIDWVTNHVGRFFPDAWQRFRDAVPHDLRDRSLVEAYSTLLADTDPAVREHAAAEWCAWEEAHVRSGDHDERDPRFEDARFRAVFARLVTHYWRHAAWLEPGRLAEGVRLLDGVPAVLIHGRRDLSSPMDVPWSLLQHWPSSRLEIIDEGHLGGPEMTERITAALDRFARRM